MLKKLDPKSSKNKTINISVFELLDDQITFCAWKALFCKSYKKSKILYYPSLIHTYDTLK